jgi:hypothetical protein
MGLHGVSERPMIPDIRVYLVRGYTDVHESAVAG